MQTWKCAPRLSLAGMGPFGLLIGSIFCINLGPPWRSAADEMPEKKRVNEVTPLERQEIKNLAPDLADGDPAVQHKAYKRLKEIGLPVISVWHEWMGLCGPEALRLECQLMAEIQTKHGIQAVRVNGLEFLASVDPVWKIPPPGGQQVIEFQIKLTNYRQEKIIFHLFGIQFHLLGPDGKVVRVKRGRDHIVPPFFSPELSNGQSHTVKDFGAKLSRDQDGKEVALKGEDSTGEFYAYSELRPGRYHFWFSYGCNKTLVGTPLPKGSWTGRMVSPPVAVEIK